MLISTRFGKILGVFALALGAGGYAACTDDSNTVHDTPVVKDAGPAANLDGSGLTPGQDGAIPEDGGLPPGLGLDCFLDPKTHDELINACTDAARIDKQSVLPLLLADGGVPKLP